MNSKNQNMNITKSQVFSEMVSEHKEEYMQEIREVNKSLKESFNEVLWGVNWNDVKDIINDLKQKNLSVMKEMWAYPQ